MTPSQLPLFAPPAPRVWRLGYACGAFDRATGLQPPGAHLVCPACLRGSGCRRVTVHDLGPAGAPIRECCDCCDCCDLPVPLRNGLCPSCWAAVEATPDEDLDAVIAREMAEPGWGEGMPF